ncbi:hypothetical protein MOV98_17325 (plasmid) [Acinetobacter variabilis]|nr:hypothetical protein MOV98_17325 [Acinetobacter variabilis]
MHHYSSVINEKGFLSIAYNGVDSPSSNTGSVSKHLGDITDASFAYDDLSVNSQSHSEEVISRLRSYKENGLGIHHKPHGLT